MMSWKRQKSATLESVQNINETTLNNESQISDITQSTKSLTQGSTGNTGSLLSFWNEYIQEKSRKW